MVKIWSEWNVARLVLPVSAIVVFILDCWLKDRNHCSYGRSSTRFFSKIASIFKKGLHLKDLNRHIECTDVSFNPENGAFSKIKKTGQTD